MDLVLHWPGDWPDHLGPLLEALQARPEIATAPEMQVRLCPDALAVEPPPADGVTTVALVPDASGLFDATLAPRLRELLSRWVHRGATLLTPTQTAARVLRTLPGACRGQVGNLVLPLAPDLLPAAWEGDGGQDIVVLRPADYRDVLAAVTPLRLAGLTPRVVLAGGCADSIVAPGGHAGTFDLLAGLDVLACTDFAAIGPTAGAIVIGAEAAGRGVLLRQALATGRPVVAPELPLVADHLASIGADAYRHGPGPQELVVALAGALRRTRGASLGAAARAAVIDESWSDAARTLYLALVTDREQGTPDAPLPTAAPRLSVASQPLAIDVVNPHSSGGGGERFLRQLVTAMSAHDSAPAVRLLCHIDPLAPFDPGIDALRAAGVQLTTVSGADAREAIEAELGDADVVYCAWAQLTDPPRTEAPLVATYHDLNHRHFEVYGPVERALLDEQAPRWIEASRALVHSSRFIEQEMHHFYDVPSGLTHVIPLTATATATATGGGGGGGGVEGAAVRTRHGLGELPFLLSPNGNHLHKNYAALVAALRRSRAAGRPLRVVATGAGTQRFHGPDLIGLGYVSSAELETLYAECAGVVETTLYEAGSFPMLEAMAVGKPVAISEIPSVREQIDRLGLVVETFDPLDADAIALALRRLVNGEAGDTPVYDANRRAVLARTWNDVAGDYLAVLGSVAAAAPAVAPA